MKKIIATAENFAFGPIGKLVTITDALKRKGYHITFIGTGTAYQLGSKADFDEIFEFDTNSSFFYEYAEDLFQSCDLHICAMDFNSVPLASTLGVPTIWIDTLFWWWDNIPSYLFNVEYYLYQKSIDDGFNNDKYSHLIENFFSVGPIVDSSYKDENIRTNKSQLLISFGGMEAEGWYTVGKETFYPYTIMNLITKHVDLSGFENVLVTGNDRIMRKMEIENEYNNVKFKNLSHKEFLIELNKSRVLMTVPGLETPLEAFCYEIPVVFLPPSNSSQYVQLDEYREKNIADASIHLSDYLPRLELRNRDLRSIMSEFLLQIQVFDRNTEMQIQIANRIQELLSDEFLLMNSVKKASSYIEYLGGNGLETVLLLIEKVLED